jgi:hypothetical protein
LFEALEVLALGIQGKRSLWIALAALAPGDARLRQLDLERLAERAQAQFEEVERARLRLAPAAFGAGAA